MGRSSKACRSAGFSKVKKQAAGKVWKKSGKEKLKKQIKEQIKESKSLTGTMIQSNAKYSEDFGYDGVFKGCLVKSDRTAGADRTYRIKWEDGTVQDGIKKDCFEVIKEAAGDSAMK
jgi:hypothetical protein